MTLFELVSGALLTLLSAVVSVIWTKASNAERTAESNKIFLNHLIKNLDKTERLTERLTSLEASVNVEIKNLAISIKRMESAILRLHNADHDRS